MKKLYRKLFGPKLPVDMVGEERRQWELRTYGIDGYDLQRLSEYNALKDRFVFKPSHVKRMKILQKKYDSKMGVTVEDAAKNLSKLPKGLL